MNLQTPDLTKYYPSCTQALTAASIQSQFKPLVETYQHHVENQLMDYIPAKDVLGTGGYLYNIASKRQLSCSIGVKPVADKLNLSANTTGGNIGLIWVFK
jgi:hypothetical protein